MTTRSNKAAAEEQARIDQENREFQQRMASKRAATQTALEQQEQVAVKFPSKLDERGHETLPDVVVGINGLTYEIARGETVEVPQSVYEVLKQSHFADEMLSA